MKSAVFFALFVSQCESFTSQCRRSPLFDAPHKEQGVVCGGDRPFLSPPLKMGRAAAVRAATKSKTDAKKAKTNALFGKKVRLSHFFGISAGTTFTKI